MLDKWRLKQEENAKKQEADQYGITLLDIKKKNSDNRFLLCLVRAILQFFAVYGTIVGVVAAFDLPFSAPIVITALLVISIFTAFIYYNKVTFYVGYVIIFIVLIIMAFAFYMYINSGFQAFLNEVISRYETFFSVVAGRVAEEQITDRYLTVSVMLIFVGGIFSIFFNITISGYMDLPMTFIVSFLPLQFAFYIDIVPPLRYLIMLLAVYIAVAVLGRSGRYTLPYKYKEDKPFGRKRKKNKQEHFYHASGSGMLWMMAYALVLSTAVILVVGTVFSSDFSTRKLSNAVKDVTDKYVKTVVVSGVTALFNRYDAVGGLSKGQLGGIRSVNPDYQPDLVVDYVMSDKEDIYLKAYTGVRYERNHFYNTFAGDLPLTTADDIISYDDYMPSGQDNITFYKMHIENVGADDTYDYQPYIPVYTTDEGKADKTGIAPSRSAYMQSLLDTLGINLVPILQDDEYETIYMPLIPGNNYGANDPAKEQMYRDLYTTYPSSLTNTLAAVSNEAGLNSEEISRQSSPVKTIMIAEALKQFYETNFTYTYTPGATPYNEDVVDYFLSKNRKGFCAHFASSATLILRYMGVPARYCEGYRLDPAILTNNNKISDTTDGWTSQKADANTNGIYRIELSDADAHSWVEIYVDGYGWIPYEMTPPSYEEPQNSGNLGIFGIFAGLFNPTERLVDDTDGSISKSINNGVNNLSEALSDGASNSGGINTFAQFARSVGYLLIPFISMIIALLVIIILWITIRRAILEIRRRSFVKKGMYGDALLLEYRYALSKLKKRRIITEDNPSVRDVWEILLDKLNNSNQKSASEDTSEADKKTITRDELSEIMNNIYHAGFSKDGITEDIYARSRVLLRKLVSTKYTKQS